MKIKYYLLLFILCLILIFCGCIKIGTLINLNKNGNGTIEVEMLMSKAVASMMKEKEEALKNPYTEEEFKKSAKNYGEVEFKSYKEISNEQYIGGICVYSFKDINKVNITPILQSNMQKGESDDKKPISFEFKKEEGISKLIIIKPEESKGNKDVKKEDVEKTKEQAELMKQLFKDMYISFKININGKIIKTDSTYVNENEITILEFDFNKIIADDAVFSKIAEASAESNEDIWNKLNGKDGIKYEEKNKVFVEFK